MNRISGLSLIAALSLAAANVAHANAVFPVGNYVVLGAAMDWNGKALSDNYFNANDAVTVMATRADGTVVAKTTVCAEPYEVPSEGDNWVNFRLDVPIASGYTETMVTNGEYLTILIVTATATYTTQFADAVRVTGAGDKIKLDFRLADDSDNDGVADEYVAELADYMSAWGYDGALGDAWGHDLVPDAKGGYFMTNHSGVWRIDLETGTFSPVLGRRNAKSFSRDSEKGDLVQLPTERWWSDRLIVVGPDGKDRIVGPFPGAKFYKARWFSSDARQLKHPVNTESHRISVTVR